MLKKIKLCDDQKLIYIVYAVFILAASVALTSWATIYQDHIINMILKMLRYASYLGCVICIALNVGKTKVFKVYCLFFDSYVDCSRNCNFYKRRAYSIFICFAAWLCICE